MKSNIVTRLKFWTCVRSYAPYFYSTTNLTIILNVQLTITRTKPTLISTLRCEKGNAYVNEWSIMQAKMPQRLKHWNCNNCSFMKGHKRSVARKLWLNHFLLWVSQLSLTTLAIITLDTGLCFKMHHSELHGKLLKSAYVIRYLARQLPSSCLRHLYFAYYHSHLVYGLAVWYPLISVASQNALLRLQKSLIRVISGAAYRAHTSPLFRENNILTLGDQLFVENCKLAHRVYNVVCAQPIRPFFKQLDAPLTLTRSGNLLVPKHKSRLLNKSFLCKTLLDWSTLPVEEKGSVNSKLLGKRLRKKITKKY